MNSNHKGQHQRGNHHSQYRPGMAQKDGLISEQNASNNGSPGSNWTLTSPLSRNMDDPNRGRFVEFVPIYLSNPR